MPPRFKNRTVCEHFYLTFERLVTVYKRMQDRRLLREAEQPNCIEFPTASRRNHMSREIPTLPANRAFVIQFRVHSTGHRRPGKVAFGI